MAAAAVVVVAAAVVAVAAVAAAARQKAPRVRSPVLEFHPATEVEVGERWGARGLGVWGGPWPSPLQRRASRVIDLGPPFSYAFAFLSTLSTRSGY